LPESLNRVKPVIGQPLFSGSSHYKVIEVRVVATLIGGGISPGTLQDQMIAGSEIEPPPLILSACTKKE
jgi:hypothetical protein